jgi:hypothetical protein
MKQPYHSFEEWQLDMDKIRANDKDAQFINHVKARYFASAPDLQQKVKEYLENIQFEKNPIAYGNKLARQTEKVLYVKNAQNPWWSV